ncbi:MULTISPECIES: hypothetical protein [unclassified Mammaliicoccus]|uniref:hypothetical protein n=1 Tax=unclassified Mammaliicoccus TaxID=2803851 RepID=UPI001EFB6E0C|nr:MULTISPECIES: hypothetical protein [unclassified Mammaliicoccus]
MNNTKTSINWTVEGKLEVVVSRVIDAPKEIADDEIKVLLKYMKSSLISQRNHYKQQRDELIEDIQAQRDLLKEFSKFIHRKVEACPGKAEYIDFRDSLKKLGITERD